MYEGVAFNAWYMDDGGVIASPDAISKVLSIFDELSLRLGVFLNRSKSELIPLGAAPIPPLLSDLGLKISDRDAFDMLGSPLGSPDYCNDYVVERAIIKNEGLIAKLELLHDRKLPSSYSAPALVFARWFTS